MNRFIDSVLSCRVRSPRRAGACARQAFRTRAIADRCVGVDYWEDETDRRYRGLRLVFAEGERIRLTAAGMRAVLSDGRSLLKAA
jgi:hypothetical protein